MLATRLLASGITHLTDARYFAAWEVDYLAFPVGERAEETISWDYLQALREWVEGPQIVADLGAIDDITDWVAMLTEQRIPAALIHHPAPADAPAAFAAAGIEWLLRIAVEGYQTAEDVADNLREAAGAGAVVLDFEQGGITLADLRAGHPFGLLELDRLLNSANCLLRIDLGETDPKAFAEEHPLAGYAVRGSSEEKVGYKSFDDLDGLFEALEIFE